MVNTKLLSIAMLVAALCSAGCATSAQEEQQPIQETSFSDVPINDVMESDAAEPDDSSEGADGSSETDPSSEKDEGEALEEADELLAALSVSEDFRPSFSHGEKPASYQKYIVLHDTESDADAASIVGWWDSSGQGVAAHFIVDKDGGIVQCAPLDAIVHHAGFGDTGHNELYGVEDETLDDKVGTTPIGSWASDYGMNSYSVGIEMVHVGGSGDYPAAQLQALDNLIAYIDAYYGFESEIIDHKAWRTGNSDTSPEFSAYLENYQEHRVHDGA